MYLPDPKKLRKAMLIDGISQRELAAAAGWGSHSYLGRLLRGEVRTLDPGAAVRIAKRLDVPVESLFVARSSTDTSHGVRADGTQAA